MSGQDAAECTLAEDEHAQILISRILPAWTSNAISQERPVTVLVAGPPGSGKSTVCTLLKQVLDRRGGAVLVGRDLYKENHPAYARFLREDERTAGARVRPDTVRWQTEVEQHIREQRFDAVVESPVVDPAQARAYRNAGCQVEIVVVAEPDAVTQLSALDRYLAQVAEDGAGRYVPWMTHEECRRALPTALEAIESEGLADRVMVVRRDLTVVYDRVATGGVIPGGGACVALRAAWARPWTADETWRFRRQVACVEQQLHPAVCTPERRLLVAGGVERALAVAEPVRRIGQPLDVPPGVAYHRLSADEHNFIYDELIEPSYLNDITPHEDPLTLYVLGSQGSGKSYTARMLRRALRTRRPVSLDSDLFKSMHPDYYRLSQEDPRTASVLIRPDYRAWQSRAEQRVRELGGDLIVEIAPDDVAHFVDRARRDRALGRRVEVVVLGVRAADSRLGIATRCAGVARIGGTPRFTASAAHARTVAVLGDVVRAAEGEPGLVDSVAVIRRDLTAVYRNERTVGGAWARAPKGGWAVEAEQRRPYGPGEAARFWATLQQVQGELPQYRSELVEIASLAGPLMPAYLRPRALAATLPVTALPVLRNQTGGGVSWLAALLRRAV